MGYEARRSAQQWQARASYAAPSGGVEHVALVAGGGRGLGLEYVRQLLKRPQQRVIAGCRNPEGAEKLQQLSQQHPGRLDIVKLDIIDEDSIQNAVDEVSKNHDQLDLLINAAGILHTADMNPETALARVEAKNMLLNYQVNAMGPILVSKAFAPLLIKAAKSDKHTSGKPAVIASMSARVGSIADNSIGGWHSYRASKSALNQLHRCMSIEFARKKLDIACILLHPGTVDTDLSKPFQKNVKPEKLFSQERAIEQLLGIIDGVTNEDHGKFIAWDGETIPW